MLVYVTGVSGSGKSAVCAELLARGFAAKDADNGISGWFRREDGVEVPTPPGDDYRTPDWYQLHEWRYSVKRATQLAAQVEGELGFLCGCGGGENEIWHLFDLAFFLIVDEATLRDRLATRTNNSFGKTAYELENILAWHTAAEGDYRRYGADLLDAGRPVGAVVDQMLSVCEAGRVAGSGFQST